MKKIFLFLSIVLIGCNQSKNDDKSNEKDNFWTFNATDGAYIEWKSSVDYANEMLYHAMNHMYNVERQKSQTFYEKALEYDASLFAPHVVLAGLARKGSDKEKIHIAKAKELVANKNETSKLFVSLLDIERQGANWPLISKGAHEIWAKMREIEPKGKLIHFYYAFTVPGYDNKIIEMEKLLLELKDREGDSKSLPTSGDHSFMIGPVINSMGYFYYANGDNEKAKELFEEYLSLYPNGYNPYDSMGEYYFNEADYENAKLYYNKALDIYPSSISANTMLDKINELENE